MKVIIKNIDKIVVGVILAYMIYFIYSQLTGINLLDSHFQFFINVATLVGILAVLEERKKYEKS